MSQIKKSTARLPHVPSVTLCLSSVCTLEITFYASCALTAQDRHHVEPTPRKTQTRPPPTTWRRTFIDDLHTLDIAWGRSSHSWPITLAQTCRPMRRMAESLVYVIGTVGFGGQGVGRLCLPFCKSTPLRVKSVLFVLCYLSMSLCLYVCITNFQETALQHCTIVLV